MPGLGSSGLEPVRQCKKVLGVLRHDALSIFKRNNQSGTRDQQSGTQFFEEKSHRTGLALGPLAAGESSGKEMAVQIGSERPCQENGNRGNDATAFGGALAICRQRRSD